MPPRIEGLSSFTEIGRGGFGVVHRARQDALGRWVAVKVLAGVRGDSEAYARFARECQALGAVSDHPNIATVYACGLTLDGEGYLAMELLDGGSLADLVAGGAVPWEQVVSWGVALAGALETSHRVGVLHRDVKPHNVMFDQLRTPKLLDFGVASVPGGFQTRSSVVTLTLAHAAPEIVAGGRGTVASDVYGLASTLYTAVAASAPFERSGEETMVPLLARIASAPVPDLRPYGVPDRVAGVLESGLAKDPAERPRSAEALGALLSEASASAGGPRPVAPIVAPRDIASDELGPPAPPTPSVAAETTVARPAIAAASVTPADTTATVAPAPRRRNGSRATLILLATAAVLVALALVRHYADDKQAAGDDPTATPTATPSSSSSATPTPTVSPTSQPTPSPSPTAPGATTPAPPRSATSVATLTAAESGTAAVTLTWAAPASGTPVGGYEVERTLMEGSTPKDPADTTQVSTSRASVAVGDLDHADRWYRWRVRSLGSGGRTSEWVAVDARVRDVVGRRSAVGGMLLRAAGLQTAVVTTDAPRDALRDLIWSQDPRTGVRPAGTEVRLGVYEDSGGGGRGRG